MNSTLHRFLEALFGGNLITGTIKTMLWILAFCIAGGLTVHHLMQP